MKHRRKNQGFTLIELLVVITIIAVLAGIAFPVFNSFQKNAKQTEAQAALKNIDIALQSFAKDRGAYPNENNLADDNVSGDSSNAIFAAALLSYVKSEAPFAVPGSRWTINKPDEDIKQGNALERGECHWSYVAGLAKIDDPKLPLVADGFTVQGNRSYDKSHIWIDTQNALVLWNDNSVKLEQLKMDTETSGFVKMRGDKTERNAFEQGALDELAPGRETRIYNPQG